MPCLVGGYRFNARGIELLECSNRTTPSNTADERLPRDLQPGSLSTFDFRFTKNRKRRFFYFAAGIVFRALTYLTPRRRRANLMW